jgi:hypothetical protein
MEPRFGALGKPLVSRDVQSASLRQRMNALCTRILAVRRVATWRSPAGAPLALRAVARCSSTMLRATARGRRRTGGRSHLCVAHGSLTSTPSLTTSGAMPMPLSDGAARLDAEAFRMARERAVTT